MILERIKEKRKLKELKKKINEIFKTYKVRPFYMRGYFNKFPDFKPFSNYTLLCGSVLELSEVRFINYLKEEEQITLNKFLYFLFQMKGDIRKNSEHEDMKEKYEGQLKDWYKKILDIGLNHGYLYMIDKSYKYDQETNVKDLYRDCEVNYSPYILCIEEIDYENYIEELSSYLANAYLSGTAGLLFVLCFRSKILQKDMKNISVAMEKVFKEINDYRINEFNEKKEDFEYMHRYDFDPDEF